MAALPSCSACSSADNSFTKPPKYLVEKKPSGVNEADLQTSVARLWTAVSCIRREAARCVWAAGNTWDSDHEGRFRVCCANLLDSDLWEGKPQQPRGTQGLNRSSTQKRFSNPPWRNSELCQLITRTLTNLCSQLDFLMKTLAPFYCGD